MAESSLNVLVCVVAHHEGNQILETCEKATLAIREVVGHNVSLLFAMDRPDEITRKSVASLEHKSEEFSFGDAGSVRNQVITKYVDEFDLLVFLDGDDYWCSHWLSNAIEKTKSISGPAIISPKHRTHIWPGYLGLRNLRFSQPSREDAIWPLVPYLASITNLWGSTFMLKPPAAHNLRFRLERDGFYFEDWWFNVDSLELAVPRYTASGTHFYTQSKGSRRRVQAKLKPSTPYVDGIKSHTGIQKVLSRLVRKPLALSVLLLMFRPQPFGGSCKCERPLPVTQKSSISPD